MKATLLDTGAIVALIDRRERFHKACADALDLLNAPLATCEPVIAEACHLLRNYPGGMDAVLRNVSDRVFELPLRLSGVAADVNRILRKYADVPADLADACLIHLAAQLGTGDILTLDSDFRIYRWGGNKSFRLLIDLP